MSSRSKYTLFSPYLATTAPDLRRTVLDHTLFVPQKHEADWTRKGEILQSPEVGARGGEAGGPDGEPLTAEGAPSESLHGRRLHGCHGSEGGHCCCFALPRFPLPRESLSAISRIRTRVMRRPSVLDGAQRPNEPMTKCHVFRVPIGLSIGDTL